MNQKSNITPTLSQPISIKYNLNGYPNQILITTPANPTTEFPNCHKFLVKTYSVSGLEGNYKSGTE